MKTPSPSKSFPQASTSNRLRLFIMLLSSFFVSFQAQAQTPYSNFDNPLFIPDTLSTWPPGTHNSIHLNVKEGSKVLFPNASPSNPAVPGIPFRPADKLPINTISYSGANPNNPGILGPTLIWWYGDSVTMEIENHLHHPTTTHWHGAHVAPWNDGGPHQVIGHGATWKPSFKIRDDVSTMWYHPHLHHHTMEQVQRGMAGMIITKNAADPVAALLPHDYGVNDFPIIFQDKYVQYDSILNRDTLNYCCSMGTIPLVNGTWKPTLKVPDKGLIRFRILNGSSERAIALSLQRGSDPNNLIPFNVIASDAGYLVKPYLMNSAAPNPIGNLSQTLIIMASERYEIVFDATGLNGDSLFLVNRRDWMQGNKLITTFAGGPSYDNPGCYSGNYPSPQPHPEYMKNDPCRPDTFAGWMVHSLDFDMHPMPILKIVPVNMSGAPIVTTLPSTLPSLPAPSLASASVNRVKTLLGTNTDPMAPPFSIDGVNFDLNFINDYIKLGDTEIWDVYNSSGVAHPFHVHDIHFFITEIQNFDADGTVTDIAVPPYMQGPKDVMPVTSNKDNHPFSGTLYPQVKYRLIGTWEDFGIPITTPSLADDSYMYHCHILAHEDGGMMHQFVVISPNFNGTGNPEFMPGDWQIFPNPSTGILNLRGICAEESKVEVLDLMGRMVGQSIIPPINEHQSASIDKRFAPGAYMVHWIRPEGRSTKVWVVE
ncbi:MAG: multicopper oxidase domain-containing protein [Phycisphaerae bacterium]|nr:multicopper oxidase domain-containing protein [Saprospiraceae bacterium]